ncbi:ABC transporter substrate-binding protein [Sneathiella litorea]|uniref:ABC transporter substrate-binding protein n=1 Tax=Sneathiella litorea TaxID=2606216 RepID=A0A6L8W791_9PROT|nr:ABC transporter substrate-binding protein [Sneathiella litorea]MZR30260.1 ABC transporter substrate-binding protein [Sneathiella litorea]
MISMTKRSFNKTLLGGLTALATIAGMTFSASAADKITVGALRFTSHAPSFVAFEKGYFTDEGLEVEFKFFQAAQPMAVAIASGDVDFGITAISGGLINLADKGAIKVIGGALQEEPGIDGQIILVSKMAYEDGVTSPAQLKGRSFGITQVGSSFHYMASKIAEKEGFSTADIKLVPLQKVGALIGALKSGQIDSWTIVPHIAKGLVKSPEIFQIGVVADYIPDYQVTTVFTSTEIAENKQDIAKRFLAAFSKGADDFNAALVDKTEGEEGATAMVELIHKYVYADRPIEKAAPSIRNGAMRINKDAALNLTNVTDQLNWFKAEGLVKESITIDTLVNTNFVKTF